MVRQKLRVAKYQQTTAAIILLLYHVRLHSPWKPLVCCSDGKTAFAHQARPVWMPTDGVHLWVRVLGVLPVDLGSKNEHELYVISAGQVNDDSNTRSLRMWKATGQPQCILQQHERCNSGTTAPSLQHLAIVTPTVFGYSYVRSVDQEIYAITVSTFPSATL